MKGRLGIAALLAAALAALSACTPNLDDASVRKGAYGEYAFAQALGGAFSDLAAAERARGDWMDASYFARLAAEAYGDQPPPPASPDSRNLPAGDAAAVVEAYREIQRHLENGGQLLAETAAVKAQSSYECWLEELEEGSDPAATDRCEQMMDDAFAELRVIEQSAVFMLLPPEAKDVGPTAISVERGGERILLATPRATALFSSAAPPVQWGVASEEAVSVLFGDALVAEPAPPARFSLYFDLGGETLTSESEAALDKVPAEIASRPAPRVSIVGHTDSVGDALTNFRLGLVRATATASLLQARGLEVDQISIESRGEADPAVRRGDNVAEPRNRRVEVIVR